MKKLKIAFILSLFVFMPLISNAQFDTMYINNAYRSQYMFPELKSPACQQVIEDFQFVGGNSLNMICQSHGVGSYENCVKKIGHRFDVTDTVKLIGTGILMHSWLTSVPQITNGNDYDSITVSIWDSNLTTELYSKQVFRATYHPDLPLSERREEQAILEVLFNDTITLTESFHMIVSTPCYDGSEETKTHIFVHGSSPLHGISGPQHVGQYEWVEAAWAETDAWIAQMMYKYDALPREGKTIVFGHWHTRSLRESINFQYPCKDWSTWFHKDLKLVGLDGCTALGNPLNVYIFEE